MTPEDKKMIRRATIHLIRAIRHPRSILRRRLRGAMKPEPKPEAKTTLTLLLA